MDLYAEFGECYTTHKPDYVYSHKASPYYLIMCFHTPFSYYSDGEILEGGAGEILINTPGEYVQHGPSAKSKSGFINDWIYVSGSDVGRLIKKAGLPLNKSFPISNQNIIAPFIKRLNIEFVNKGALWKEKLSVLVCDMIITIARNRADTPQENTSAAKFLDLRKKISTSLDFQWTLEKMAETAGYSPSRFSYLYKKQFGVSPMQDLTIMRVDKAQSMLGYGDTSISMTSYLLGFSSINYFSYVFKKYTGLTPAQYKKKFDIQTKK